MKSKRFLCLLMSVIMVMVSLSACQPTAVKRKEIKAMFIPKSRGTSFWEITIAGFNTAVTENNIEGKVVAPLNEEDIDGQIALIENAVEEGYNLIILSSINYEKPVAVIEDAISKGVQFVSIDSDVNSQKVKVRISTDNYAAGYKMGKQMAEDLGGVGNVGLLIFDENTRNGYDRISGFTTAISEYPNMNIVTRKSTVSNSLIAMDNTVSMLRQHPNIQAVASFNELTTVGVGMAIEELSREDLYAIGFDNNATVVDYLEKGVFDALVVQNQFSMGYLAVEYGIDLVNGIVVSENNIDTGINIVTRNNIYNPNIQTILFPFSQNDTK